MGTRSTITAKKADGTYIAAYCHWDGYPSHNGKILVDHYNSQERAEELLGHGDMSFLDERCDKPDGHSYENRIKGCTAFYHRDRGEDWDQTKPKVGPTIESVRMKSGQEFEYLWDGEKWLVGGEPVETVLSRKEEDE